MKDGTNTDMPRGVVSRLRSGDFRMGQPTIRNGIVYISEYIGYIRQTQGTETSQYLEEGKAIRDFLSSGERTGISPNQKVIFLGL